MKTTFAFGVCSLHSPVFTGFIQQIFIRGLRPKRQLDSTEAWHGPGGRVMREVCVSIALGKMKKSLLIVFWFGGS